MNNKLKEVRKYFKDNGCVLIENNYLNARTKMRYKCVCGNLSNINFNNFKSGKRCGCEIKEKIKKEVEFLGYKFISTEYRNNNHVVTCICKCGNEKKCQLKGLKRGQGFCNKCIPRKLSFDYNYVYDFFKEKGCTLLDKEYINAHKKLKYICVCGNNSEIALHSFKKGNRCKECGIKKNKIANTLDPIFVEKKFKESGCKLIDNYIKASIKMKYICSCGKESKISWNNFSNGRRCLSCGTKKRSGENHYEWNVDRKKHKDDLTFRQKSYKLIQMTMKVTGRVKNKKTAEMLGYDYRALQSYIKNHQNYENVKDGPWHVDHIFPIKAFIDHGIFDVSLINCLENLQPLSAKDNLSKNSKYNKEEFLSWIKSKGLTV
jgi:hypothetical protein